MVPRPPYSTRTDALVPYPALVRSRGRRATDTARDCARQWARVACAGNTAAGTADSGRRARFCRRAGKNPWRAGQAMKAVRSLSTAMIALALPFAVKEIGRASCRERVCQYV